MGCEFFAVVAGRDLRVGGIPPRRDQFADNASREVLSGWQADYDAQAVAVDQIVDQAIAGMVTHERIPRIGLSHELELDRDLLADLALAR